MRPRRGEFGRKSDPQSDPNLLGDFDGGQLSLLERHPKPEPIEAAIVLRQRDLSAAILLSIQASGMTDKQVYGPLRLDAATFSKIRSGQASFPANRLEALRKLLGNDIPLQWWAHRAGYELRPLRSDLERRVVELEEQLAQERHDRQVERDYAKAIAGRGG